MSDSDDTDVLLLIPPDFFLADTGSSSGDVAIESSCKPLSAQLSPDCRKSTNKLELNQRFSDQCTIDHHSNFGKQKSRENSFEASQMYHSTPKMDRFSSNDYGKPKDDFIKEIDTHFLNTNGTTSVTNGDVKRLAVETIKKHNSLLENRRIDYQENDRNFVYASGGTDPYNKFGRMSDWRNDVNRSSEMKKCLGGNDTLLSLNEIWDASGKTESATVHEERTRREVT